MAAQPTGTVTLLFTDVEGSTRLLERLGRDRYAEGLEHHRVLLRESFGRYDGFEVSCEGDSFFVAFPRAEDAVRAAADGQRALHETSWPHDLRFPVRMGVHTGEPKVVPPNYVGLDVHRAARVMSVSSGGQILVAARTADLVEGELAEGLALRQLGRFLLKDFDRPEPLAELVVEGLPGELPPPRAERAPETPRRRRAVIAAATLVVAAAAAAAGVLVTRSSGGAPTSNVVVSLDAKSGKILQRTSVGNSPASIVAGAGGVWVVNNADATVSQLDESGRLVRTFGTTGNPTAIATSPNAVWVGNEPDTVMRLDPSSGNITATLPLHLRESSLGGKMELAVARGRLWISSETTMVTVDLATLRTMRTPLPPPDWGDIVVTSDAVWESTFAALYHLDALGRRELGSVAGLGGGPIAAAGGYIWAVDADVNAVAQVDPRANTIVRTVDVGQGPTGIASGAGRLWVTSSDGTVTGIDPATARVTSTVQVGGSPQAVAVSYGRVWIAAS